MHVLVLGAAGMVGRKLVDRLLRDGRLGKADITKLTLHDVVAPAKPEKPGFPVEVQAGDFAVAGAAVKLIAGRPDVIFHLAAIVSGEAELDFDKGYRINLDGTRMLIDAIRLAGGGYKPRLVFTSSIAVFGAPFPEAIGDEFFDDKRHGAALQAGETGKIGPRDRRTRANEVEEQIPVDLPGSFIGGGLFAGKDKLLHRVVMFRSGPATFVSERVVPSAVLVSQIGKAFIPFG